MNGPGAVGGVLAVVGVGLQHGAAAPRHEVQEVVVRLAQRDDDRLVVGGLDGVDAGEAGGLVGVGRDLLLERPHDVVGDERLAAVERRPVLQRERVHGGVVGHLRQLGEPGLDLTRRAELQQRLVDVVEQHLVERRAGDGDDVEARRLEDRADGDGGIVGGRRRRRAPEPGAAVSSGSVVSDAVVSGSLDSVVSVVSVVSVASVVSQSSSSVRRPSCRRWSRRSCRPSVVSVASGAAQRSAGAVPAVDVPSWSRRAPCSRSSTPTSPRSPARCPAPRCRRCRRRRRTPRGRARRRRSRPASRRATVAGT